MRYITLIILVLVSCGVMRQPANQDPVITLEKTACYGACPVYAIHIYSSGVIRLTAKENLSYKGEFCARLKHSEWERIRLAFSSSQFFSYKDQYTSRFKDLPSTFITFRWEGKNKTIEDYDGAPDELRKLELLVTDLIQTQRWKACNPVH